MHATAERHRRVARHDSGVKPPSHAASVQAPQQPAHRWLWMASRAPRPNPHEPGASGVGDRIMRDTEAGDAPNPNVAVATELETGAASTGTNEGAPRWVVPVL